MPFIILLIFITLCIAGSAAFFSVYGMAFLFTGAMIPVIIMGGSLEAGKLIAASFLYRFRKVASKGLKIYLSAAIIILMAITSMGIAGFLTAAYQKDTIPLEEMQQKIELFEEEQASLLERRKEIDLNISSVPADYVTAKQKLMREYEPERAKIDTRLQELTPELQELKTQEINVKAKVGPILFISEVFGQSPNKAVIWFIAALILVFDPLAVALTYACNVALEQRKNAKDKETDKKMVKMDSLKAYIDERVSNAHTSIEPLQKPNT